MKLKLRLLLLICMIGLTVNAQKDTSIICNIGDVAPPLRVHEWLKGTPVKCFEKGKVYVVEFWATWCRPCIASMPHLSGLARKYKHEVTFAVIDVFESHATKPISVKTFVESMGRRMDFNLATEDTNFTTQDWFRAFDEEASIPKTFVIDRQGRAAWIGHPHDLDMVLQKIVNNTWDIKEALAKRIYNDYLEKLDTSVIEKVRNYIGRYSHLEDLGKPDSTLFVINQMVKKEPNLKYAPWVASYTFSALLLSDPQKAYEFGKQAMITSTYEAPPYHMIIGDIKDYALKINITKDIYRLGAECYQAEIDGYFYPELVDMSKKYREMAAWYRLAGDKLKAIEAEKKAIKFEVKSIR